MAEHTLRIQAAVDQAQQEALSLALGEVRNGTPRIISRAVNHELPVLRNAMVNELRKLLPLQVSVLRKASGYRLSKVTDPSGRVWMQGRPIALSYFKPVPSTNFPYTRRGRSQRPPVGVAVMLDLRSGDSGYAIHTVIPHSFIVRRGHMLSEGGMWGNSAPETGNRYEVVERLGKERRPLLILHGPAPGDVLEGERLAITRLEVEARRRLAERVNYEAYFLYEQALEKR